MNVQQFQSVVECPPVLAQIWHPIFEGVFQEFDINNQLRQAGFLARLGHESAGLNILVENLNYSAEALLRQWPARFSATDVAYYARNPERIANRAYSNRYGNGDYDSGDGWTYRGRGPMQITFKANYLSCGLALSLPLVERPLLLLDPQHSARAAGWFWKSHGCNQAADTDDCDAWCDIINLGHRTAKVGDANGYTDTKRRYDHAMIVLL